MREKVEKYFRLLYPNYDALSSKEEWYAAGDKTFIIENIEEIDKYYQDCMKPGSLAQHQGLSEQEIIADAVRVVKGDKYFEMLHPEYETLTPGEKFRTMDDQGFILDNIDQIDRKFQDMVAGAERNGKEVDEQKIIRIVFDGIRADKYSELLHQDREQLTPGEELYVAGDWNFIFENIEEVDKYYKDCMKPGSLAQHEGLSEQEIIADAVRVVKGDKYFELLHPEYETLTPGEKFRTMDDQGFILDNIDQIDRKFQDMVAGAERNGEEVDEHAIIKSIVEGLKTKELTTQQIGKATINVPTTTKAEAEQVENSENTKDNVIEGEEVGDDN